MAEFKAQLDAIDSRLWLVLWAFVVGGLTHGLKLAGLWKLVPSPLKVPLSTASGALVVAAADVTATGDLSATRVLLDLFLGGFSGLSATGGHQFLARLPSAQTKQQPEAAKD